MSNFIHLLGGSPSEPKRQLLDGAVAVFIDTEFTTLDAWRNPALLSIGLVAEDGREFYAEIDTSIDRTYRTRCSLFVRGHVLTQFRRVPGRLMPPQRLVAELAQWLQALGAQVIVCHDHGWDFNFVESAIEMAGGISTELIPRHVGHLFEGDAGLLEMKNSVEESLAKDGLREHHALADARALRARLHAISQ
jgi:hypothetical protein